MTDGPGNRTDDASVEEPVKRRPWSWSMHQLWMAVAVVVVVLVALLVPLTREDDGAGTSEEASEMIVTPDPEPDVDPLLDSDGDGLPDVIEIAGWKAVGGTVYVTDPHNADTDADGLSDGEEAGPLVETDDDDPVYTGVSDPTKKDSDDDGLSDFEEVRGWETTQGFTFITDPMQADTDGDGLSDAIEAGALGQGDDSTKIYAGFSDPLQVDTDNDKVDDAVEADHGTDPYASDTDQDGLTDYEEIFDWGTDPTNADTDGDGFTDDYEVENGDAEGLDPLFHDEVVSKWDYAEDFAAGAVAGDAMPRDSLAWLAGNLAIGSAGLLPTIGWIIGGAAEIRDAVVALIKGDWVGVSFSLLGAIPAVGAVAAVSSKLGKFVKKFPHRAPAASGLLMDIPKMSERTRIDASKIIWGDNWQKLRKAGADDKGLLRLQESGRIDLKLNAQFMERPGHVRGKPAPFFQNGREGEDHLLKSLTTWRSKPETQKVMPVSDCVEVCNQTVRIIDAFAGGVAHESKVGYRTLDALTRRQILSDAHLIQSESIKGAHWHFYPSGVTDQFGPSGPLLDLLDKHGIKYTIHAPIVG